MRGLESPLPGLGWVFSYYILILVYETVLNADKCKDKMIVSTPLT